MDLSYMDVVERAVAATTDELPRYDFVHNDIRWTGNVKDHTIRAIVPMEVVEDGLFQFVANVLTTLLSETTNNDACDVTVRERSAHLDSHTDLDGFHDDLMHVIYDAKVEDWLT